MWAGISEGRSELDNNCFVTSYNITRWYDDNDDEHDGNEHDDDDEVVSIP